MKRCLAVCITLFGAAAWAQDGAPVFRATSELVLLDVRVIQNKTNTAAGQLHAKDFEITEDSVPQKISFFDRDQLPLPVVLLFDLSDSVRGVLHRLAAGAQTALDHLKPEDEMAVMVYAASASLVDGFTRDHSRTVAAVERAAAMKSDEAAFSMRRSTRPPHNWKPQPTRPAAGFVQVGLCPLFPLPWRRSEVS